MSLSVSWFLTLVMELTAVMMEDLAYSEFFFSFFPPFIGFFDSPIGAITERTGVGLLGRRASCWCWTGFVHLVLPPLILFLTIGRPVSADQDAKRLYEDLLTDYNRLIRPVGNNSDRLTVKLGLKLSQLIDVVHINTLLLVAVAVSLMSNTFAIRFRI